MSDETSLPPAVLAALLTRMEADRAEGSLQSVEAYQALYPGYESAVAHRVAAIESGDSSEGSPSGGFLERGDLFAEYQVESLLGQGGQGVVYLARDSRLNRSVALKILDLRGPGLGRAFSRFQREAKVAARLEHPGICAVYESGISGGMPFIAMQYVDGTSLSDIIGAPRKKSSGATMSFHTILSDDTDASGTEPAVSPPEMPDETSGPGADELEVAIELIEQAARVVHAAHEAGVVHRDIKPGNIMVRGDGSPVLLDFGLAQDLLGEGVTLTRPGDLFGTPSYMSPEQLLHGEVELDRRTDVWSLGVVLFEYLAWRRPFEGPTRQVLYQAIVSRRCPDIRKLNRAIQRDLAVVVETALEKDRNDRYQSALDFAEELRRVREHKPILARPTGLVGRAVRWSRRNPALAAATSVIALTLLVGAGVATMFAMSANESAAQARIEKDRADAKAAEAEATLADWDRLADGQRLRDLRREADAELWPAYPDRVPGMVGWLERARNLGSRLEDHRSVLVALQQRAQPWTEEERDRDRESHGKELSRLAEIEDSLLQIDAREEKFRRRYAQLTRDIESFEGKPELTAYETEQIAKLKKDQAQTDAFFAELSDRRETLTSERENLDEKVGERVSFAFPDARDQLRHDGLQDLVKDLDLLVGSGHPNTVTLASLEARLVFARTVRARSMDEHASEWTSAIERIAKNERYGGLAFSRQMGLIPLGPDPKSELEEFAQLQTGDIATRDPETGKLLLTDETGIVLVLIPGGTFNMGAQTEDPEKLNYDSMALHNEGPIEQLTLSPFLLSKYEMTWGQWLRFTGAPPSTYREVGKDLILQNPVERVTWIACDRTLSRLDLTFPTEAQWEYACRAGTTTPWWTGTDRESLRGCVNLADQAAARSGATWPQISDWPGFDDGYGYHAPVGSFRANGFGLHDVHGNVSEWCRDWLVGYSQRSPRAGDGLRGELRGRTRMHRGGGYYNHARVTRSAHRIDAAPGFYSSNVGVRPAKNITPR